MCKLQYLAMNFQFTNNFNLSQPHLRNRDNKWIFFYFYLTTSFSVKSWKTFEMILKSQNYAVWMKFHSEIFFTRNIVLNFINKQIIWVD